jgi:3-ketosteroid 9alpha-monooxygenase subunit B
MPGDIPGDRAVETVSFRPSELLVDPGAENGQDRHMSQAEACGTRLHASVEIDLDGTRHRLRWPRDKTLVDVMVDAGIDAPHSCREGHCGSCVATVVSGQVIMVACDILDPSDLAEGLILGCQARPLSDDLHIEY